MGNRARTAIGLVLLVLLLAIPLLHLTSEVLFSLKQSAIEKDLAQTLTKADFLQAAEAQGMDCEETPGERLVVICDWWDFPVYGLIAWVEFEGEGVQAIGYFVDDARSEDYLVRKVLSGP